MDLNLRRIVAKLRQRENLKFNLYTSYPLTRAYT